MRLLKLALISFISLFIVVTGISLFIPFHIRISKAINIVGTEESVMQKISEPEEWRKWYPGLDTAEVIKEQGIIKGYRIRNRATILLTTREKNEVRAEFAGGNMKPVQNVWKTTVNQGSDSLTLQWYMDFNLRWYPWEKFASLLLEKSYGPRMEKGLSTIKKDVEN